MPFYFIIFILAATSFLSIPSPCSVFSPILLFIYFLIKK